MNGDRLLYYDMGAGVEAFSTRKTSVLPCPVVTGHQVHDCRVAVVDRADCTREDLRGYDAYVTDIPGCAVAVRTADCVPILLYDPVKRAVAAVHSGWKGTVRNIAGEAVAVMRRRYGCTPSDMIASIGPAIGPKSFQVGPEVVEYFRERNFPMDEIWAFCGDAGENMRGGHHIDLFKANEWLLNQAGITEVFCSGIDTYTSPDFYSARREGPATGRTISAVMIKD